MGFKNGAYATVWETRDRNGRAEARMSINRKDQNGNYVTDWSDWVTLIGAAKDLVGAAAKTRIRLGDVDVSNRYDKEKKVMYVNYKMFTYENPNANGNNSGGYNAPARPAAVIDDPDAMPF